MPRRMTAEQASKAIYIDLEGTAVDPPSLLGFLAKGDRREAFHQIALDKTFVGASVLPESGDEVMRADSFEDSIIALVEAADSTDRLFVGWSTREKAAVDASALAPVIKTRFVRRYVNAITIARRWKNRFYPEVVFPTSRRNRSNSLHNYMQLIGYNVPKIHGPGIAAKRIRDVKAQILKRGEFSALSGVAKRKWTNLLRHNFHDCYGMRFVVEHCLADLESANTTASRPHEDISGAIERLMAALDG